MKAILEFDLPADRAAFEAAAKANALAGALRDYAEWLRSRRKYGDLPPGAAAFADEAWRELHEALNARDVAAIVLDG